MKKPSPSELKETFTQLQQVPDAQLQWLIRESEYLQVREGGFLFRTGDPVDSTILILEGMVSLLLQQANQQREVAVVEKGSITAYLPYSRGNTAPVNALAKKDTTLLKFPRTRMKELISDHFELTQVLVHEMTNRVRFITEKQQQNEKMTALGKLSAGLAHELNNPAAAVVRSSKSLKQHLGMLPENFKQVISVRIPDKNIDEINELIFSRLNAPPAGHLPLLERSRLEDDLADCLEERGVDNAGEVAQNLVDFGFECSEVEHISELTTPVYFPTIIKWVNDNLTTEKMVAEIEEASRRIASLVSSVKNFTHMDQTQDKVAADIHEGIENTLTMLNHKVKKSQAEIIKKYDSALPMVPVFVSEINQVWTNLLDNALDALEGNGAGNRIEIATSRKNEMLSVSVTDNGPGIPESIRGMIFDPFFTTKPIGKGTGLGLDVVQRIIKQHQGDIHMKSRPGQTVFEVLIPLNGNT